jgi:hypothetical protein
VSEPIDFQGIAILVGALTVSVTSIGGFVLTAVAVMRQSQMQSASVARDQKLEEVRKLVNGLSASRSRASRKAGRIQGADQERAHPTKKK